MRPEESSVEVLIRPEDFALRQPAVPLMKRSTGDNTNVRRIPSFESVLLAIAGHDLRQPLQALQSMQDLLGTGVRTKSELRLLQMGQRAINRMKGQLDQLVTALRLCEPGRIRLRPVALGELIRQVGGEIELEARRKRIALRVVPTSANIQSDALLFGAILRNLLANAVKYTDAGGRILVGCRQAGGAVRIEVLDTGIGIDPDKMSQMFEAFTRIDASQAGGLGIGLFIVRQAARILGHRLEIASTPSRGTRFSIVAAKTRGAARNEANAVACSWDRSSHPIAVSPRSDLRCQNPP
jgi:two-component system phosphate regulon sensor histidine kinase PhoR